jgi:hypothetical protein
MRSGVLSVVKMSILIFWTVTVCRLAGTNQGFGTYYLHLQGGKINLIPHLLWNHVHYRENNPPTVPI